MRNPPRSDSNSLVNSKAPSAGPFAQVYEKALRTLPSNKSTFSLNNSQYRVVCTCATSGIIFAVHIGSFVGSCWERQFFFPWYPCSAVRVFVRSCRLPVCVVEKFSCRDQKAFGKRSDGSCRKKGAFVV
mmetsp:Transcript_26676/g.27034  ORF Transcript_26676/g.27034 Transcript_26676/m.27034 type:complete len:129 (-) Transcript_26676:442-828(-)